jgi:hypothetical protein
MQMLVRALAIVTALAGVSGAAPLPALLDALAANGRFPVPTRGVFTIQRIENGIMYLESVLVIGHRQTLYLELRNGFRALVRPGKMLVHGTERVEVLKPGTKLGDTDFLVEDLMPVTRWLLKTPQVSDEGPTGTVVTGAPAHASTRALLVLTIDPEADTVTRTKYYEGSISNLIGIRRDETFADVGGHRRPTQVVLERTATGMTTTATITWQPVPDTSHEIFTLKGLGAKKSPITW